MIVRAFFATLLSVGATALTLMLLAATPLVEQAGFALVAILLLGFFVEFWSWLGHWRRQ